MKRFQKTGLIVLIIVVSVGIGVLITYIATRPASNVPADIRDDLTFTPLVPPANDGTLKTTDFKIGTSDDGTQTLSYIVRVDGASVVVSQHTQPSQFVDIPEYKERFLNSVVNQTATVQTANGVIYLGQTKDENKQIGVMLEKGLLIFFNPNKTLNEASWRIIGDSLVTEQVRR